MANAMSFSGRKCRLIAAAAAFVCCVSFAPEALAKAHCWCQAAKSDCGSCAEACVVKDFGAIGEFRDLDVRKDALCQASCVNRVKAADRPQQGSWPGAGELDIFEAYNEGNDPRQGYIGGVCLPSGARDLDPDSCKKGGGTRWYESTSSPTLSGPKSAPFWATWHVYAVEWDPAAVRFSLDGKVTNEVKHLDMVGSRRMEYQANVWQKLWPWARLDWERKLTTFLPDSPFYWILNLGIKKDGPHSYPNPAAFVPEELVIDWVRVSTR